MAMIKEVCTWVGLSLDILSRLDKPNINQIAAFRKNSPCEHFIKFSLLIELLMALPAWCASTHVWSYVGW
jgi:hypothetical protein